MPVNLDKPQRWKADVARSVDMYNAWFLEFAPTAFRTTRMQTTRDVEAALLATGNLTRIDATILRQRPEILPTLRMSACPPLAVDRLIGLSGAAKTFVGSMERKKRLPPRMSHSDADRELAKLAAVLVRLADPDVFVWLNQGRAATTVEVHRAATIVADRLCGAFANPIVRNAQERRQLAAIKSWLEARGYREVGETAGLRVGEMPQGSFAFRLNVPVKLKRGARSVNIPIDVAIMRRAAKPGELPLLFEAKSAGDFTNTNKRRKEEAAKVAQLRATYGKGVRFSLFLCGYFDGGYLGYEAAEGIDWVWEHRIDDLASFGL